MFEPGYVSDPTGRWAEQREWCPIAFTERRQRTWLPVRYEDLSAIAHDVERFSSPDIAVVSPLDVPQNDVISVPPLIPDTAFHNWARRLLLPAFGSSALAKLTLLPRAERQLDAYG